MERKRERRKGGGERRTEKERQRKTEKDRKDRERKRKKERQSKMEKERERQRKVVKPQRRSEKVKARQKKTVQNGNMDSRKFGKIERHTDKKTNPHKDGDRETERQ